MRRLPRSVPALQELFDCLQEELDKHGVGARTAYHLNLAAEELFTNMVRHNVAHSDAITFEIEISDELVRFRLTDHDVEPWDPQTAPDPRLDRPVEEREPGGLGLLLVRSIVDRVEYEQRDRDMRVTVEKRRG